jgi:hypothetical protein
VRARAAGKRFKPTVRRAPQDQVGWPRTKPILPEAQLEPLE